jgi:hypothetical protein
MFQNRNAELIKSVNSLKKKLQKGAWWKTTLSILSKRKKLLNV